MERSFEGLPLSQFDKDDVETAGMIKLDVLGVRMQSAMAYTVAEVERTRGERVDIDAVGCADEPTFEMIRSARTLGCFQIESPGQRELVGKLLPRDIGDLIVDISLFRPGPVNSDMVTPYLDIRHGRRVPAYPHEDLAATLAETGGVVIFHEQVLRIIHAMTGCGLPQPNGSAASCPAARPGRRRGSGSGRPRSTAATTPPPCSGSGRCSRRSAGSVSARRTRRRSPSPPTSRPGSSGTTRRRSTPGCSPTTRGCTRSGSSSRMPGWPGLPILPVDVNASAGDWRVEPVTQLPGEGLRAGLREVKGISEAEVARIIAGQPYASLRDLWERAALSRPVAERLILVGALDSLSGSAGSGTGGGPRDGLSRRDLLARVGVLDRRRRTGAAAQAPLGFGGDGFAELVPAGELRELTTAERVEAELEILGIDLSQHVLGFYDGLLRELGVVRSADLRALPGGLADPGRRGEGRHPDPGHPVRHADHLRHARRRDRAGGPGVLRIRPAALRGPGVRLLAARGRAAGCAGPASRCRSTPRSAGTWPPWQRSGAAAASRRSARPWRPVTCPASGARRTPVGPAAARRMVNPKIIYPNGFVLSPYAETGSPGAGLKDPPRRLWHASPGSSGGVALIRPVRAS